MLNSKNMNDNCPIIIYDKSKNFVIKTYKKKNNINFLPNMFNEAIMSKKIIFNNIKIIIYRYNRIFNIGFDI